MIICVCARVHVCVCVGGRAHARVCLCARVSVHAHASVRAPWPLAAWPARACARAHAHGACGAARVCEGSVAADGNRARARCKYDAAGRGATTLLQRAKPACTSAHFPYCIPHTCLSPHRYAPPIPATQSAHTVQPPGMPTRIANNQPPGVPEIFFSLHHTMWDGVGCATVHAHQLGTPTRGTPTCRITR